MGWGRNEYNKWNFISEILVHNRLTIAWFFFSQSVLMLIQELLISINSTEFQFKVYFFINKIKTDTESFLQ